MSPPNIALVDGDPPILLASRPVSCANDPCRLCDDDVGIISGDEDESRDGDMGRDGRRWCDRLGLPCTVAARLSEVMVSSNEPVDGSGTVLSMVARPRYVGWEGVRLLLSDLYM
jgi:hypothetical protein